jgi:beta-lactamase regulating signal transducer with metallopeptidase domain
LKPPLLGIAAMLFRCDAETACDAKVSEIRENLREMME